MIDLDTRAILAPIRGCATDLQYVEVAQNVEALVAEVARLRQALGKASNYLEIVIESECEKHGTNPAATRSLIALINTVLRTTP